MGQIVAGMIRAGPVGKNAVGHPRVGGVVVGFMSTIGETLASITPFVRAQNSPYSNALRQQQNRLRKPSLTLAKG